MEKELTITPELEKMGIIRMWETTEINPEEIAKYLQGELEESDDADSQWNIHLYYGKKSPLLTLKLHPEKRNVFLAVNKKRPKEKYCCYSSLGLMNVERVRFTLSQDRRTKKLYADVDFLVRNKVGDKSGLVAGDLIISSESHYTFGCKKQCKCKAG
jgi:hypothetical protein